MKRDKQCKDCSSRSVCQQEGWSWFFIIIGFLATVAIRAVTLLMHYDPLYGKIAWYVGIGGFVVFFIYKYRIFKARAQTIEKEGLLEKVSQRKVLNEREYAVLTLLLCQLRSQKERINFFFIFFASFVSLILAIYFDFIVKL